LKGFVFLVFEFEWFEKFDEFYVYVTTLNFQQLPTANYLLPTNFGMQRYYFLALGTRTKLLGRIIV